MLTRFAPTTLALCLASPALNAGSIRLIEDRRGIDLDVPFSFDAPELDIPANPLGADVRVDETTVFNDVFDQGGFGEPRSYTITTNARQASAIDFRDDGSVRIATDLSASNNTEAPFVFGPGGSRSVSLLDLTFESDSPVNFLLLFSAGASGDEARGAQIVAPGGSLSVGGFSGFVRQPEGTERLENEYTFEIETDPDGLGQDVKTTEVVYDGDFGGDFIQAFRSSGTLDAGVIEIFAIADAAHDTDDPSGFAEVSFELFLTPADSSNPIPTPSAALAGFALLGGLAARRRRNA